MSTYRAATARTTPLPSHCIPPPTSSNWPQSVAPATGSQACMLAVGEGAGRGFDDGVTLTPLYGNSPDITKPERACQEVIRQQAIRAACLPDRTPGPPIDQVLVHTERSAIRLQGSFCKTPCRTPWFPVSTLTSRRPEIPQTPYSASPYPLRCSRRLTPPPQRS